MHCCRIRALTAIVATAVLLAPDWAAGRQGRPSSWPPAFNFQREWQVSLGPVKGRIHRGTSCPDGTLVVGDDAGWVRFVRPDGTLRTEELVPAFHGLKAITCDTAGSLYAAVTEGPIGSIVTWDPSRAATAGAQIIARLDRPIVALAVDAGGFYAVTVDLGVEHVERGFIKQLGRDGAIVASLGDPHAHGGRRLPLQAVMTSSLTWDAGRQKVLFVPGNSYELHIYSADGASRRVLPRNDPDFQAVPETALQPEPRRLVSQDSVAGVRQLPNGSLVVQVMRQRVTNGALPEITPGSYLEVLNPETGEVAGRANLQLPAGVLCGTSPDGGLYFAAPSGQTREVIARKGRLHAVEP